jgi:hypothetical protein
MSETIKWSFSMDRCVRRCEREAFLQYKAAWHNSRDPVRREAFLSKQVKTLELWQGSLVHRGIELFVIPAFEQRRSVNWDAAIAGTLAMADRQLAFSAARRYREKGMSKAKAGDDYCALVGHETAEGMSADKYSGVQKIVERSLLNLSQMSELLDEIGAANKRWPELELRLTYDIARIEVRMDLLFFRSFGKPTIVDWKVSEAMGGSDADLQMALYAWALCQNRSWRVEQAQDCELVEVQLLTQDVLRHRCRPETLNGLEDRIYRSVNMMESLGLGRKYDLQDLDDYDFARNPNSCALCSQRGLCQQLVYGRGPIWQEHYGNNTGRKKRERDNAMAYPQLF